MPLYGQPLLSWTVCTVRTTGKRRNHDHISVDHPFRGRGSLVSADIIPLFWERLGARFDAGKIQRVIPRLRPCIGLSRFCFEAASFLILLFLLPCSFLVAFLWTRS